MALSATAPSYWVLVLARVLSGAGEGSFQTVVPPYIDDHAPPAKRGLWLALFFCGIPVGTALGNVYGGFISTALSWRWAFALGRAKDGTPVGLNVTSGLSDAAKNENLLWTPDRLTRGVRLSPTGPTLSHCEPSVDGIPVARHSPRYPDPNVHEDERKRRGWEITRLLST
jgi:hypothetical protein